MSKLAGVAYVDSRPTTRDDEARILCALHNPAGLAVRVQQARGVLAGYALSLFDEGGRVCATSARGDLCVWDGRLDNGPEVALRFGAPLETSSACDLALTAYKAAGPEGLRELIGDWSLVLWDEQARTLLLASDFAGIRPLYYHYDRGRVLWSSSLSDLVRWTGINELDEDYIAGFLTQGIAGAHTPYRGIHPIPPGCAVLVSSRGVAAQPFWEPPLDRETRYKDERCYEEHLKALFREAVGVRLQVDGPTCAELSGGLDSSSVVCMARSLRSRDAGRQPELVTFSYSFQGNPDEKYFQVVERACGFPAIHLAIEEFPVVAANQLGDAAPGWWEPRFREVARQMTALGSHAFLTGQLGDFVMGNTNDDSDQVADFVQNRQFMQAAREAFAWSQSLRVPIYSILWRALRTNYSSGEAASVAQSLCDRYGPIDSLAPGFRKRVALRAGEREQELRWEAAPITRRRRLRTLNEILSARVLQTPDVLQQFCYTHPYVHRPLLEFMLTIPAAIVCRPGEPRRLMRGAFSSILPTAILRRKSKGAYHTPYHEAVRPFAQELLKRTYSMRLVEFGYIDRESVTDRLNRFVHGLECNESQLRQIILLEFWLRSGGLADDTHSAEGAMSWIQ